MTHMNKTLKKLKSLRVIINLRKSQLKTPQEIVLLGVKLKPPLRNTCRMGKKIKLVEKFTHFSQQKIISYTTSMKGPLYGASSLIVLGRLQLRPIQRLISFRPLSQDLSTNTRNWEHSYLPTEGLEGQELVDVRHNFRGNPV